MPRLNVWVLASVLVAFVSGGFVGWVVTRLSCQPGSCLPTEVVISLTSGFVAAFGVGVVIVLADQSMKEWRDGIQATQPTEPETNQDSL